MRFRWFAFRLEDFGERERCHEGAGARALGARDAQSFAIGGDGTDGVGFGERVAAQAQQPRPHQAQTRLGREVKAALDGRERLVPAAGGKLDLGKQRHDHRLVQPGPEIGVGAEAGAERLGARLPHAHLRPIGVGRRRRAPELQVVLLGERAHLLGGAQNIFRPAASGANQKAIEERHGIGPRLRQFLRARNRLVGETLGLLEVAEVPGQIAEMHERV